jgi:hypothetical protein
MGAPVRVVHDTDPAEEIVRDVGYLCDDITVMGADVLIVMYERLKGGGGREVKTAGNIILPNTANTTAHEDRFQGKVGLVMKTGPIAFQEDDNHKFGDIIPKVGDWVLVNVSETYSFDLPVYDSSRTIPGSPAGERRARIVADVYVKAIVSPKMFDAIW